MSLARLTRTSLTACTLLFLAAPVAAQNGTPPTVTITGQQGTNTEGTMTNPFRGSGIRLGLDIQDPDPSPVAISGWRQSSGGDFCPGSFQFFGSEGPDPVLVHPRVESGLANITVSVNVTESPHDPVVGQRTFFVAPPDDGQGCPNGPAQDVALSVPQEVGLGETIPLVGSARDVDSPNLVFRFFVSSSADPEVLGTLIGTANGQGCDQTLGCVETRNYKGSSFPTTHYFQVEVDDGVNTVPSAKQPVLVTVGGGEAPPEPTPKRCFCGATQVLVDAGPVSSEILGGSPLALEGAASGSVGGNFLIGNVEWVVGDDGGLGGGLVVDEPSNLETVMSTPDVDEDTAITIELQSNFGGCECTDTMNVTLLADPPPSTDISVQVTDSRDPVTVDREFSYQITVRNDGPEVAPDVELRDQLPSSLLLVTSSPEIGSCTLEGSELVCDLGDLSVGAEVGVTLNMRAVSASVAHNAVVVNSDLEDANPFNNSDSETTVIQDPYLLYFAQFGDGAGALFSQILLVNLDGAREAEVDVFLRDDDGDDLDVDLNGEIVSGLAQVVIPPAGSRVLLTDGVGDLAVGSVTVVSDTPLAGVILFGGVVGLAGVGSSPELPAGFVAPVQSLMEEGEPGPAGQTVISNVNTGIAVMNLTDDEIMLELRLTDTDGNEIATSEASLPGRGHLALFVDELFAGSGVDFSDFEGLLEVFPSGSVSATVIQVRPDQFATLPVVPLP